MNVVPNYYHKFKCIADKCKHNCCIGWEIDIDADTMDYYKQIGIDKIEVTDDVPHFKLAENDRCPYLLESGLCEIILQFGEDALCDICADHPRFRNFYDNFTETGLGLCCEEAANVILNEEEPFSLIGDMQLCDWEKEVWDARKKVLDDLQDRSVKMSKRLSNLAEKVGFRSPIGLQRKVCDTYLSLERLDDTWTAVLNELTDYDFSGIIFGEENLSIPFEQLACYFIFRHFSDGYEDESYVQRIRLALSGCMLIGALCEKHLKDAGEISTEVMAEYARMYSSEVEYSEENINKLLSIL